MTTDVELDALLLNILDRLLRIHEGSDNGRLNDMYGCMRPCALIADRRVFGIKKPNKYIVAGQMNGKKE